MKKIIYIALLSLSSAILVTSCTQEEVKPQSELKSSGGGGSTDPVR